MKTAPLLVGAALLFWGWETGLWIWALVMALVLEGPRVMAWRRDFTDVEFNRLWDLSALLFVGAAVYSYNTDSLTNAVQASLQWLPITFFPITAAQAYSSQETIGQSTFFWLLRRKQQPDPARLRLNIAYPYFALCLLAASAANARDFRFYCGICLLVGFALAWQRPARLPLWGVGALFLLVVALGQIGHNWLQEFQSDLETGSAKWLFGMLSHESDEQDEYSAMGQIGTLKLSGKILMRIELPVAANPPPLLRQASFTRYNLGIWYGTHRNLSPVKQYAEGAWQLIRGSVARDSAVISMYLPGGHGLLPLPLSAARLNDLPASEVFHNRLGAVRAAGTAEMVRFQIHYGARVTMDGSPDKTDLEIPENEEAAVSQAAAELRLDSQPPRETLKIVADFFETKFRYTRFSGATPYKPGGIGTPLGTFLLQERAGHCEYFASATVLLLRHAGIPARYATGFAVHERRQSGRSYVVRARHAHAWAVAYIDGHWRDYDTTPASWDEIERARAPLLEPLADWWSALTYKMSLWRWSGRNGAFADYLIPVLASFLILFLWRILSKSNRSRFRLGKQAHEWRRRQPGLDSEFYLVEARLNRMGLARADEETPACWVGRLRTRQTPLPSAEALNQVLALHYRYRFDPLGITEQERATLGSLARQWLALTRRKH